MKNIQHNDNFKALVKALYICTVTADEDRRKLAYLEAESIAEAMHNDVMRKAETEVNRMIAEQEAK